MMRLVLVVDTLLGPEGMTVWLFLGPCALRCRVVRWGGGCLAWLASYTGCCCCALVVGVGWCCWCGVVVAGGLFVENYTVDASIFVVKLSRADGGCLGTRSR